MDFQDLKQRLNDAGFSEEVLAKLNEIVDQAMAKGSLDDAARKQMMDLIDLDVESGTLEADTMEEMAMALKSLADQSEDALAKNEEDESKIEAEVEEEVKKVENAVKMKQEMPAAPTAPATPTVPTM